MLIVENQPHFDAVKAFAKSVGAEAELQKSLDFLSGYGGSADRVRCRLRRDFAPHSFTFVLEMRRGENPSEFGSQDNEWRTAMMGGLIYSGPGLPADGSYPSLTVSLNPDAASGAKHMWTVNT